jgi:hypothetical protein
MYDTKFRGTESFLGMKVFRQWIFVLSVEVHEKGGRSLTHSWN